jgi:tRNA dimethylallyltransferase
MNKRLLVIVGPTASGKTDAAINIAKTINGEIISSDSMQVYKSMPILSQAPSGSELKDANHYLVGIISPDEEYSAAKFSLEAGRCIKKIFSSKKVPIITGGTGLYIKALVNGLFKSPESDKLFRLSLEEAAKANEPGYLHDELMRIDPESARTIHRNDTKRMIRALEIFHLTGKPKSEHLKNTKGLKDKYDIVMTGIDIPRAELYDRIDSRVDKMFDAGAVKEAKELAERELSLTARSVLGLKEIKDHLDGKISIADAKELLKKNTRNYAKRQMTWFRQDERIKWFKNGESLTGYCISLFKKR